MQEVNTVRIRKRTHSTKLEFDERGGSKEISGPVKPEHKR